MNSWGPEWGENGIAWVRYGDFREFVREAYGLDPLPKQGDASAQAFDCEIGLVQVDANARPAGYLPLRSNGGPVFSSRPLSLGTRFKVEVKNNTECYVYVFGQETDGTSYTLFPYPSREDPAKTAYTAYCGITGYRLFPRNKSLEPDSVGNRDYIAVVVSRQELPWFELNQQITAAGSSYENAVRQALQPYGIGSLQVGESGAGNLRFTAPAGEGGVAYAIVAINKQ
jgi:hypothetical protein